MFTFQCLILFYVLLLLIPAFDFMFLVSKVREGINLDSLIKYIIPNSCFLNLHQKEVENVNKGGWKVRKHVKILGKKYV